MPVSNLPKIAGGALGRTDGPDFPKVIKLLTSSRCVEIASEKNICKTAAVFSYLTSLLLTCSLLTCAPWIIISAPSSFRVSGLILCHLLRAVIGVQQEWLKNSSVCDLSMTLPPIYEVRILKSV